MMDAMIKLVCALVVAALVGAISGAVVCWAFWKFYWRGRR